MKNENRLEISWELLKRQLDLHKFADMKSYFSLGVLGFIGWKVIPLIFRIINTLNCSKLVSSVLILFVISLLILSYIFSLFFSILAILPQIKTKINSPIFWGNSAKLEIEEIKNYMKTSSDEELINDILSEYQVNSMISYRKFKFSKYAFLSMIIALISFIILYSMVGGV